MRLLCNLPLECFQERSRWPDFEVVTFGPPERMWVDGVHFPFDVAFDPSRDTLEELLARLPNGFRPDAIVLWWPDQEPLPAGLERAPCPVVGITSDYNLTLPAVAGLWPFFDLMLVDRSGVEVFRALSFARVEAFCQFTFKERFHRIFPGCERTTDIGFAGNLNPVVQRERLPFVHRLLALRSRGLTVDVRTGIFGEGYGRFLNGVRIGWNRSIRGEMNLRAFEVPACGALLFMERENLEVRDHFVPDEEVVLYGDDDLEESLLRYSLDDVARERIARAGTARVREHSLAKRLAELAEHLEGPRHPRPPATPFEIALGRATAMLGTWASPEAVLRAADEAVRLGGDDPRTWNLRALAWLRCGPERGAAPALADLQRSVALGAGYLPGLVNLRTLLTAGGRADVAATLRPALEQARTAPPSWHAVDGLLLPLGCSARNIDFAHALAQGVVANRPDSVAAALLTETAS